MRILHLTLKKKWFDMIQSGSKKEEYREIKDYWANRLLKEYDVISFRNGYSKNAPQFLIEFLYIGQGFGIERWGAPNEKVYILTLGNIINQT